MRPIGHACYQSMFHRIIVDVIQVPCEIALVTDRVLPKPPLSECKLAIPVPADRYPRNEQASAEVSFDATPASGEIRILFR
jgi:hypothetical protein